MDAMDDFLGSSSTCTLDFESADEIENATPRGSSSARQAPEMADEMETTTPRGSPPAQREQTPKPGGPGETESADSKMIPLLCGVCDKEPPKYKCSKCYLPYCSVACNKIHRETHPADAAPPAPKPVPRPRLAGAGMQKAGTRADVHATLAASEQLKYLFQKYPRLQSQLLEIHSSVFQTDSDARIPASMRTSVQSTSQWDKAKGLHRGREALAKARNAQDGEGLREYTELVIYMLHEAERQNNKPEANADQASQDVTKLLEQLLTPSK